MNGLIKAKAVILNAKTIAISGHLNPDGDSIGSLLALGLALEKLGKRVYMISADGVPRRYRSLPGAYKIVRRLNRRVDLAITVDCSSKDILGKTYDSFKTSKEILEIDHHDFRRSFGTAALIDDKAAAVGEMIFILLNELGIDINREVAQNLMTSLIVETNSFRLPNVRPLTFEICTDLISRGVDFYKLVDTVFWSKRQASAALTGICLSRCKFIKHGKIAWSIIRKRDFDLARGRDEDVDPVPDEMRSIENVMIAILFRESRRGLLRVSLRSKNRINIASLAEQYGGGGHFDVAGCNIKNNEASIKKFLRQAGALLC